MDQFVALGERLAQARENKGLSQAEVAKAIEAGQSTVAGWEQVGKGGPHESEPSLARLVQLAELYGVRQEWLAFGTGPMVADGSGGVSRLLDRELFSRCFLAFERRSRTQGSSAESPALRLQRIISLHDLVIGRGANVDLDAVIDAVMD